MITNFQFSLKRVSPLLFLLFTFSISHAQIEPPDSPDNNSFLNPVPLLEKNVVADFEAEETMIFANTPVKFHNLTTGGATFFKWTFMGGSPKVTYHESPNIMYYTPGVYDVTLEAIGMNGSSTVTKENYIQVLAEETGLPPGWEYQTSPSQQIIAVPFSVNPRIFEVPLDSGDFVGVFYYDAFNQLKCAGAAQWDGMGAAMVIVNGNNPYTPLKDGFYPGEVINWKVYSAAKDEEFRATAIWDYTMPTYEVYIPNGVSALTDLYAGVVWELTIQQGWSAISSPVDPWHKELDIIFGNSLNHVIYLENSSGIFHPDGDINTIGNWQNKGYLIKMAEEATIQINGYPLVQTSIAVVAGWNMITVPVNCEVQLTSLLQNHTGKVVMVKEAAGLKSFVPVHEIFTLQSLLPGKAYLMQANQNFTLQFLPCP